MISVFVPRERRTGETRVAATPETVKRMKKEGLAVLVETGAGESAYFSNADYEAAGARLVDLQTGNREADLTLSVGPPDATLAGALKPGSTFIGLASPHKNLDTVRAFTAGKITALAMELVPRITRAQKMDVLSSQANIAGYKAVVIAAARLHKYFPLMMTAAGTAHPARVVILGAGVAGLQAIATAHRLGAIVEVSDIRPAVKEQVQSLGGKFIDLPQLESGEGQGGYAKEVSAEFLAKQREVLKARIAAADIVITTAQVPGRPAPKLMDRDMVDAMKRGAVIVDLAADSGGNCELTQADREVDHNGVLILGPTNLAATMSHDASAMYARNVLEVVLHITRKGELNYDPAEEINTGMTLTHAGEVRHAPTAKLLTGGAA